MLPATAGPRPHRAAVHKTSRRYTADSPGTFALDVARAMAKVIATAPPTAIA